MSTAASRNLASTTTERVISALREDILSGALQPGERVKILDIAARYGVSPLPVREALARLEGERLVELAAHRGATIRPITAKLIRDLYDVRGALEVLMVERAVDTLGPRDLRALAAAQDAWEQAAAPCDPARLLDANARFHGVIALAADNDEAADAIQRGWPLTVALRIRLGFSADRLAAIRTDHLALMQALAARDADAAREIARRHARTARDELLQLLDAAGLLAPSPTSLRKTA